MTSLRHFASVLYIPEPTKYLLSSETAAKLPDLKTHKASDTGWSKVNYKVNPDS